MGLVFSGKVKWVQRQARWQRKVDFCTPKKIKFDIDLFEAPEPSLIITTKDYATILI
jgi:hypothetical protein